MSNYQNLFAELPKGPISEIIIQRITDALIRGDLKPGDKIPTEMEFSEKLGVGRNAVREAIKVLVEFGVLEIYRSEGTFVVKEYNQKLLNPLLYGMILSNKSLEDLLEFKIAFLGSILYLAASKAGERDIKNLRRLWQEFAAQMGKQEPELDLVYQASEEFNRCLGQLTKNPMLIQLNELALKVANYTMVKAIQVSMARKQPELLPDSYRKVVELLEKRDLPAITKLLDEKLRLWQDLLL